MSPVKLDRLCREIYWHKRYCQLPEATRVIFMQTSKKTSYKYKNKKRYSFRGNRKYSRWHRTIWNHLHYGDPLYRAFKNSHVANGRRLRYESRLISRKHEDLEKSSEHFLIYNDPDSE